ncbi:uncharacterized protein LOC144158349 [Haemaphysalis longicornis]
MSKLGEDGSFFLLSLVEVFPVLWDPGNADYNKTCIKSGIWKQIAEEMALRHPEFAPYTVDGLKSFMQNKRRTYREERKKVVHTKSGQPADDVYVGKWKFFGALKFLDGATQATDSHSVSEDFGLSEMSGEGTAAENHPPSPVPSPAATSHSERDEPPAKRGRSGGQERAAELLELRTAALAKMAQCMDAPMPAPDDCSAFGAVVAGHIRQMTGPQRAECQAAIMALISERLQRYQ